MKKKRKLKRRVRIIARLTLFVAVIAGLVLLGRGAVRLLSTKTEPEPDPSKEGTQVNVTQPQIFDEPGSIVPAPHENAVLRSEEDVTYLILNGMEMLYVNKQYTIPATYGGGVDAMAGDALQQLYDAAAADGLTLYTVSGYRSYDTQKSIYENNIATRGLEYTETISARPGTSEHQTGLSFDVGAGSDTSTVLSQRFANTPEYAWLEKNMADYGFILRYPDGKTDWTGYVFEPWHIRYVGSDLAHYISSTGLCVEELASGAQ